MTEEKVKHKAEGCYKTTNTKTGKSYVRKRPAINATVSESTLDVIKDLSLSTGMTFTTVVEKCIMYGIAQFRKVYVEPQRIARLNESRPMTDAERVEDRFMRKKIFDFREGNQEWQTV